MRLFIAIGLPPVIRAALSRLQSDLRVGRHVDPDNLHITLAFLDEQSLQTAELLHEALSDVTVSRFDLRVAGLDVFGRSEPRLVFAGVEKSAPFVALRNKVRIASRTAGIDLRRERFRPHITLARFNRSLPRHELDKLGAFLEEHGDFHLDPFPVEGFGLYRSILEPDGPVYDLLAEYPLDGSPDRA